MRDFLLALTCGYFGAGCLIGAIKGSVDMDFPGMPPTGPWPETRGELILLPLSPLGYIVGRSAVILWRRTGVGKWLAQPLRKKGGS